MLDGPQPADLFVDIEQLSAQFAETLEVVDLALRLAALGRRSEGFTHGLAVDLPCEAEVWAMSRLAGLMAAAVGFAAATADGADRSTAEVSQVDDLRQDGTSLTFERGEGLGHGAPPIS